MVPKSSKEPPNEDSDGAARILRSSVSILAIATAIALFWGVATGISLLAGGAIALANTRLLHELVIRVTDRTPRTGVNLALFGLVFRYILLFFALYVIFAVWQLNVVAVAIGLSVPVIAIGVEAVRALRREFEANKR